VVYESGATGFGLARVLTTAGWRCEVAASSQLRRAAGDRVKTDARDALHLARLLRLDEVVPVRIPTQTEEAARDLVRAREAALRHGIVYAGGKAWRALTSGSRADDGFEPSVRALTRSESPELACADETFGRHQAARRRCVRSGALPVCVVVVPPLVGRGLGIAVRRVLPLFLATERGDVEIAPRASHRLIAAAVDEIRCETRDRRRG
jgi:hypothetical protein